MEIRLKSEVLLEELDLPYGKCEVYNEIIDHTRWSVIHQIVFKYKDKYWRTNYSVGATESQDEMPWEFDDYVTCTEVERREVTKTEWVAV